MGVAKSNPAIYEKNNFTRTMILLLLDAQRVWVEDFMDPARSVRDVQRNSTHLYMEKCRHWCQQQPDTLLTPSIHNSLLLHSQL